MPDVAIQIGMTIEKMACRVPSEFLWRGRDSNRRGISPECGHVWTSSRSRYLPA